MLRLSVSGVEVEQALLVGGRPAMVWAMSSSLLGRSPRRPPIARRLPRRTAARGDRERSIGHPIPGVAGRTASPSRLAGGSKRKPPDDADPEYCAGVFAKQTSFIVSLKT